jgi:uncharacterized protein YdeI (BOF family)
MKKTFWAVLAASVLVGSSCAFSQDQPSSAPSGPYPPPGPPPSDSPTPSAPSPAPAPPRFHVTTVSSIIATRNNMDKDDHYVTMIGHVTGRTGDETFFFTDGTGTIRLDSAKFELPIGPKIVVGGRIDQAYLGIGHLEVDVRRWRYAQAP